MEIDLIILFDSYTLEILKDGFLKRNYLCFFELSHYITLPLWRLQWGFTLNIFIFKCAMLCGLHYRFLKTTVYQSWKVSQRRKLSCGRMKFSCVSCIVDPEPKCFLTSSLVQGRKKKRGIFVLFCFFRSKSLGKDSLVISFTKSLFDLLRLYNWELWK